MNAERDLDELLGAYALDAVDDAERIELDEYLAASPRAATEVARHREVASLLAYSGAKAPDGLWERISGSLYDTPAPPLPLVRPVSSKRRRPIPTWVASAAAAAVFGVLGVTVGRSTATDPAPVAADALALAFGQAMSNPSGHHIALASPKGDMKTSAVVLPSGQGFIAGSMLPPAGEGYTWQLWGKQDGDMVSLGVLGTNPDIAPFSCGADMPSALYITKERVGGVPATREQPMLSGEM